MLVRPVLRPRAALLVGAVVAAGALAVPAAATAADSATVTGYVEETGHVPTTGVDVYLWTAAGVFVADTVTDSAGVFTFADLPAGGYKVEYENQNQATAEWFSNKPDVDTATVLTVADGATARADAYLTMGSENVVAPGITGTAAVGSTLTSTIGQWYPTPSFGFARQWLRDGVEIAGATATTYPVVAADAGARISVRVTADNLGTRESATSAETAAVTGGTGGVVSPVAAPTITGTAAVGRTVAATPGTWSPSDVTVAYQWRVGAVDVAGATAATFTLLPAHAGLAVSVRVTATRAAASASQTSAPATVAPGTFVTAAPGVAGTPLVGSVLTATAATWTPTAAAAWTWRDADTDLVLQSGGATYALDADDVGRRVVAVMTGTATGYATSEHASAPVGPVTAAVVPLAAATAPVVTGTARVGGVLALRPAAWTGSPTSVRHTWLRNGVAIAGATGTTYRLTAADAGRTVSVRSTATRGTASATSTSAASAPVAKATSRVKVTGKPGRGRIVVTVVVTTAGTGTGKAVVTTKDRGRTVTRTVTVRKGRASVTLTGLAKGRHVVAVAYRGDASSAPARGRVSIQVANV